MSDYIIEVLDEEYPNNLIVKWDYTNEELNDKFDNDYSIQWDMLFEGKHKKLDLSFYEDVKKYFKWKKGQELRLTTKMGNGDGYFHINKLEKTAPRNPHVIIDKLGYVNIEIHKFKFYVDLRLDINKDEYGDKYRYVRVPSIYNDKVFRLKNIDNYWSKMREYVFRKSIRIKLDREIEQNKILDLIRNIDNAICYNKVKEYGFKTYKQVYSELNRLYRERHITATYIIKKYLLVHHQYSSVKNKTFTLDNDNLHSIFNNFKELRNNLDNYDKNRFKEVFNIDLNTINDYDISYKNGYEDGYRKYDYIIKDNNIDAYDEGYIDAVKELNDE